MKINFACDINLRNILRWMLGVVLIWAALGKMANLQEFYAMLTAYQLPLPPVVLQLIAIILPWMELLSGLLLFTGFRLKAALVWALILFVVFAVCSGQAWLRGLHIACGCLDLRIIGILPDSKMAEVLESVGFSFTRALALTVATIYLLRWQETSLLLETK